MAAPNVGAACIFFPHGHFNARLFIRVMKLRVGVLVSIKSAFTTCLLLPADKPNGL